MTQSINTSIKRCRAVDAKQNNPSLPLTTPFPHSPAQSIKKLKTGCVSGRWLGCSFSWISRAVYDSSLLGPDGGSLASSVLWVETTQSLSCVSMLHDMSTTQLHLFFCSCFGDTNRFAHPESN